MTRYANRIALIILSTIIQFYMTVPAVAMPEGKITLQIIDENRNPMPGIEVVIGFDGIGVKAFRGYTDARGSFTASYSTAGGVSYAAKKDGYYESQGRINLQRIEGDRWVPWNEQVQLMLRKIEKPVPMFARNTKLSGLIIPVANKDVGFDLVEYDWVPPFGAGKQGDIIFKLERKYNNADDYDCSLIITFSEEYDGIQLIKEDRSKGSLFKLPRHAPEKGYQRLLSKIRRKGDASA
jgi:hypothetical protein